MVQGVNRRGFLACSFSASAGLAAGLSLEEKILLAAESSQARSVQTSLEPAADPLPTGKIRHVEMSRLILGGNLIAGVAHARDFRRSRLGDLWKASDQRPEDRGAGETNHSIPAGGHRNESP